jgi:hypothetical protein
MLRILFITLFITTALTATSSAQGLSVAPLSPSSVALLAESRPSPQASFDQGAAQPKRDSRLNGFLIGFAIGAVPGIMLGMGINTYCNNEAEGCPLAIPIFGGLFGLAGGGIGYAIDGAIHGQSLTFGRPHPSPAARFSFKF